MRDPYDDFAHWSTKAMHFLLAAQDRDGTLHLTEDDLHELVVYCNLARKAFEVIRDGTLDR